MFQADAIRRSSTGYPDEGAFPEATTALIDEERRRQYESLIKNLENELARLRNLPFENPAPFEDLPELPDPDAARILDEAERDRKLESVFYTENG